MPDFPLKFHVSSEASTASIDSSWSASENTSPPIPCSIPPEFNGPGNGYSPEGLFGISILSCMIAMFKVHCHKLKLQFTELKADADLTMDFANSDNCLAITEIDISIRVRGSSEPEKVRKALEYAIANCPLGFSIKSGKTFNLDVS